MDGLNILFLAKYAPIKNDEFHQVNYVQEYVEYHKELYMELTKHGNVIPSNDYNDIIKYKDDVNFIFSVYNKGDFKGSELLSSTLAEKYGIPYLGAYPDIRAVAEDKHLAKILCKKNNIITPKWHVFHTIDQLDGFKFSFKPPYFIKPRYGANSDYIDLDSKQDSIEGAYHKIKELLEKGIDVIVEEYINGIYYTVPAWMIDNDIQVLPSIRQYSNNEHHIVTHNQKIFVDDGLHRDFNKDEVLHRQLEHDVKILYHELEPLDFARFDFMVDEKTGKFYFLEMNICCSLSSRSTFAMATKKIGYDYETMIKAILESSLYRSKIRSQ